MQLMLASVNLFIFLEFLACLPPLTLLFRARTEWMAIGNSKGKGGLQENNFFIVKYKP